MTETTWSWPTLDGEAVYDVNGRHLGRVRGVDLLEDRIEIELLPRIAHDLQAPDVLRLALEDVIDATDDCLTLREEGRYLAHPETLVASRE